MRFGGTSTHILKDKSILVFAHLLFHGIKKSKENKKKNVREILANTCRAYFFWMSIMLLPHVILRINN
jgi:hypothetical protein